MNKKVRDEVRINGRRVDIGSIEIEGIDVGTLEEHEGRFFGFDDCFDWVSDRAQLVKDLEIAVNLFTGMAGFQRMDPYECAKLVIANR